MKTAILLLAATLVFSSIPSFSQDSLDNGNQLPSCKIDGFRDGCRIYNPNGDTPGTVEVNGCSVACPADYLPVCAAGNASAYCSSAVKKSTCECKKLESILFKDNYIPN